MRERVKKCDEICVDDFYMPRADQLMDTPYCIQLAAVAPIAVLFRLEIGLEIGCSTKTAAIVGTDPRMAGTPKWPLLAKSPIATLYTEGSDGFVTSGAASIAIGQSEPVPGGTRTR